MMMFLGAVIGVATVLAWTLLAPGAAEGLVDWLGVNLGHSTWLFAVTLLVFHVNLTQLGAELEHEPRYSRVVFLDQLSDVWMHLFIGIGVVWTAVGMRDALVATLAVPGGGLVQDAGQVLGRLVDGGILLALTTTIVGALGGYAMRLVKTIGLGASLSRFYHQHDRQEIAEAVARLGRIHDVMVEGRAQHAAASHQH